MAIKWLPPQVAVLKKFGTVGMMYVETRRQFGKTTLFSGVALRQMMKHKGRLVTFASASLNVGKELIYKQDSVLSGAIHDMRQAQDQRGRIKTDATAIHTAMADFRRQADEAGMKFTLADGASNKDYRDIDVDGIADLFERSRLEMRVWHSSALCSRTQIIAPNPATARGFTGDVLIDEIGFIPNFGEVWEAMEPIASRDPSFRVLMASTPPPDESHLCYKIGAPPEDSHFEPCGDGHWYRSQAGVLTLRVDVWDAELCGVRLHDLETRKPITPEQHRESSLDKDGWDRNYALKRIPGGLVAMPGTVIDAAMERGKDDCIALDLGTIEPHDEARTLARIMGQVMNVASPGHWGLGYDIATTTNKKSNPSSMTLTQAAGNDRRARFIVRWKSANPDFSDSLILGTIEAVQIAGGTVDGLGVDASNERYFATTLKTKVQNVPVHLVVSGEVVETGDPTQPKMRNKERLGNMLVNLGNDHLLALPKREWLKTDFLLTKKEKGLFVADVDPGGNHSDTFDSTKLSMLPLAAGGPVEAIFPTRGNLAGGPGRSPHPSWIQQQQLDEDGLNYG